MFEFPLQVQCSYDLLKTFHWSQLGLNFFILHEFMQMFKGWKWLLSLKCVEGQCKKCSSEKSLDIPNLKDEVLHYNEFLVKSVPYMSKKTKEMRQS